MIELFSAERVLLPESGSANVRQRRVESRAGIRDEKRVSWPIPRKMTRSESLCWPRAGWPLPAPRGGARISPNGRARSYGPTGSDIPRPGCYNVAWRPQGQNTAGGTVRELIFDGLTVIGAIVALWSLIHSYRLARRQSVRRSTAAQSAKLRAVLDRNTTYPSLLVFNDGASEARDISIKIGGTPIMEQRPQGHFVVRDQQEVRHLGPGGSARYILTRTKGISSLFQIEINWTDDASALQSWRSELSLAVAGD